MTERHDMHCRAADFGPVPAPLGGNPPLLDSVSGRTDRLGRIRALDQDDQEVGDGDEHDARREKDTAVERGQAKACAPPAQVGAEVLVAEPSSRATGQPAIR